MCGLCKTTLKIRYYNYTQSSDIPKRNSTEIFKLLWNFKDKGKSLLHGL